MSMYFAVEITVSPEVTWIKVNIECMGYYRVNYESDMWAELGRLCASKVSKV